jgi:uncharacterized repeat protein (TIGR03803 family)
LDPGQQPILRSGQTITMALFDVSDTTSLIPEYVMRRISLRGFAGGGALFASFFLTAVVQGQTFQVLYSFAGASDGSSPSGTLLRDPQNNLYGTTLSGGKTTCNGFGCGTFFKLNSAAKETVLYRFHGQPDANAPTSLILDGAGNLFGTGSGGGANGYGAIFKINASDRESLLYSFMGGADGQDPHSTLIRDGAGNLYGTTLGGGDFTTCFNGCGTVYKVDESGNHTVLHTFTGPPDGDYPLAGLVMDAAGNLYGATNGGGTGTCGGLGGCGVVFKIDAQGVETIVHNFTGYPNDGAGPNGTLLMDAAGNLYGTTVQGGASASNMGTVFKLDPQGVVTILHSFTGGRDGGAPSSQLVRDATGSLYGTTYSGGMSSCGFMGEGCGVVFRVDSSGNLVVLHAFSGGADGAFPYFGGLTLDPAGNLYGVASGGGTSANGVVFRIRLK